MNIATILPGGSVRARNLTVILFIAALAADNSRIRRFASSRSLPGRMITSTPTNPITTALQRRSLTSSCSTSTAAIVANRGAVKLTAVASRQRHDGNPIEPSRHRDEADRGAQQVKADIAAAQQTWTAFYDPRQHEQQPEQAAKKGDLERVHRLCCDAYQYVHHHRAASAQQYPQRRAGSRCKPRRCHGQHSRTVRSPTGDADTDELRRAEFSEAARYRRAARPLPPGSPWSNRHSTGDKRQYQDGCDLRTDNRARRRCEIPTRSPD